MKNEMVFFPIMGNVEMVRIKQKQGIRPLISDSEKKEMENNRKTAIWNARKTGRVLLKKTAKADKEDIDCLSLMRRNRAVHTHLLYFCGLVRYANYNGWRAGYGEYRIRVNSHDIGVIHSRLKNWCRKNLTGTYTAVSIGVGTSGYVYVYFLTTSPIETDVSDTAVKFYRYMRRCHFTPVEVRPYEKNPMEFLQMKYNNDMMRCIDEVLQSDVWAELWQVMRAGFTLPSRHKTMRTEKAIEALQNLGKRWSVPLSYEVLNRFSDVCSGFYDGNDEQMDEWGNYDEDAEDCIEEDGIDTDSF